MFDNELFPYVPNFIYIQNSKIQLALAGLLNCSAAVLEKPTKAAFNRLTSPVLNLQVYGHC